MTGTAYRPYRGTEDLAGMATANARLRARLGLLEGVNLAAMEHRYANLVNSDPLVDCLIAERDGATVGYARTEWHDLADGLQACLEVKQTTIKPGDDISLTTSSQFVSGSPAAVEATVTTAITVTLRHASGMTFSTTKTFFSRAPSG